MHLYEHVVLARQDVSAQQVDDMVKNYTSVIEEQGGSVSKSEYWGVKSLAYKIRKNRKAHYTLLNIAAPPAAIAEMERRMRFDDNILRFMTIRVEDHDEGPSIMMQKRDRDDRRRRDDRPGTGNSGSDDRPNRDGDKQKTGESQ